MNKRIVYLSQMYEKIGDYLQQNGDAHVSSISTHCNHPEQIYYTLNLENLNNNRDKNINGCINIRYVNVPVDKDESTEEIFNILCSKYIEDTACDGQLFCGCRSEDCEKYQTQECIDCLKKHLKEIRLEESVKTMSKSKIERN